MGLSTSRNQEKKPARKNWKMGIGCVIISRRILESIVGISPHDGGLGSEL